MTYWLIRVVGAVAFAVCMVLYPMDLRCAMLADGGSAFEAMHHLARVMGTPAWRATAAYLAPVFIAFLAMVLPDARVPRRTGGWRLRR
ncbi:hypothetical protein A3E39_04190 [Candidatus Uhrbacteria bacterium RIFCSPHIGHO2_12_FULL_60_25]|uniref:Uncharacterized protein n=1 Tax=Candidatus Uhrbacteria bacterium RIFCSPHIGHO2_12_FULL_60_25 TaxID=1802399 RepID=A0A1F7UMZ6_9BACT|nr:MAG: hypothetical protein A3D73_01215 [Candidatus Uhrbacteria bacterium RIFCSPHIGHO2_02_FULL_60_44]OGL79134.1 MAG: hypothetical protein A3E39_04190 [Candidatus Uhrbacteria bacterium RIFCSPHIGHO2_12_FULL_60_25]